MHADATDAATLHALTLALRDRAWIDPFWDARAKRIAWSFGAALDQALATMDLGPALDRAREVALDAGGDGPALHGDTVIAASIACLARTLVGSTDGGDAVAVLLARVARAALLHPPRDCTSWPAAATERLTVRGRKALVVARDKTPAEHPARGFATACFDQVSHALTLLAAPECDAARVLSDATRRACSIARQAGVQGWSNAAQDARIAIARRALVEAAATLAATALELGPGAPDERGARLWMATVALELVASLEACAADVAPCRPKNAAAQNPGHPTAPIARTTTGPTPTEATMKDTATTTTPTTTALRVLTADATDAAWRTAGTQFVKLARDPLVAVLARHLGPDDPSLRARIAAFLDTEIGAALFAAVLSAGLSAVPATAGEVPQRLARELRVRAMADASDLVADVLMGPLREVMGLYLRDVGPLMAVAAPAALEEPAVRLGASSVARDRDAATVARD